MFIYIYIVCEHSMYMNIKLNLSQSKDEDAEDKIVYVVMYKKALIK